MPKLGCVLLAAGFASRFGTNKLFETFSGETLIAHALALTALDCFDQRCVVTQYDAVAALAESAGILCVRNDRPEAGISESVKRGAAALSGVDGWLFLASDQPALRPETLKGLAALWREAPDIPAALALNGQRRAPCILPARLYAGIQSLTGDVGGAQLIKHEAHIRLLEAPADELMDVDRREDLLRAGRQREV